MFSKLKNISVDNLKKFDRWLCAPRIYRRVNTALNIGICVVALYVASALGFTLGASMERAKAQVSVAEKKVALPGERIVIRVRPEVR
jgi:hypothetical protein